MFHFSTFAPYPYAFRIRYPCGWVAPFGNPRITALLPAPLGLSQVHASFIASQCQDIHRAPLLLDHTNRLPRLFRLNPFPGLAFPVLLPDQFDSLRQSLAHREYRPLRPQTPSTQPFQASLPESSTSKSAPTIIRSFIAVFALSIQTSVTFLPSRERPAARLLRQAPITVLPAAGLQFIFTYPDVKDGCRSGLSPRRLSLAVPVLTGRGWEGSLVSSPAGSSLRARCFAQTSSNPAVAPSAFAHLYPPPPPPSPFRGAGGGGTPSGFLGLFCFGSIFGWAAFSPASADDFTRR